MSEFATWVRNHPDIEAVALAEKALEEQPDGLVAVVADGISRVRRAHVRGTEQSASLGMMNALRKSTGSTGKVSKPAKFELPNTLDKLRAETFKLGNGTITTWGQATAWHHRERIGHLNKMMGGIRDTITRHEMAIEIIGSAGVQCLDDLAEPSAAKALAAAE